MKTTVFNLSAAEVITTDSLFQVEAALFKVPSLPAYSVLSHSLDYECPLHKELGTGVSYSINDTFVQVDKISTILGKETLKGKLTVMYAGIRNYSLLFPFITNNSLRVRLGKFAEEAEAAFDNGAWMSFVLMAGAVVEGILENFYTGKDLNGLIDKAHSNEGITDSEHKTLHEVRKARNMIHPGKHELPFVDRSLAMDTFLVYDKLLKRIW